MPVSELIGADQCAGPKDQAGEDYREVCFHELKLSGILGPRVMNDKVKPFSFRALESVGANIYALPTPLQLPLQNLVLMFFTLLLAHLNARR